MGEGAPRSEARGCGVRLLVAVLVTVAAFAGARWYLGEWARQNSMDVCERSDVELVRAAGAGDLDTVQDALATAPPDTADQHGNTALGCAIPRQRTQVVAALLASGADPNRVTGVDTFADLPLELALQRGDGATASALLDHGADPNGYTQPGEPPLVSALRAHDDGTVTLLLDHGADPDHQAGVVPLALAAADGTDATVAALLAHGAQADGRPGDRPLVNAASSGRWDSYARLRAAGTDLSLPALDGWPETVGHAALTQAAGAGTTTIVDDLLAAGIDPNEVADSPLLRAVTFGHDDVVAHLLDAGADPDLGETDELTLSVTVAALNPDLADRLDGPGGTAVFATLSHPAPADVARFQVPPVAAAVGTHRTDALRLLLEHGADPNRLAADRYSPLYLAAITCDAPATSLLLEGGADPARSPADHDPIAAACDPVRPLLAPDPAAPPPPG